LQKTLTEYELSRYSKFSISLFASKQNQEFEKAKEQVLLLPFCMGSNPSQITVSKFWPPQEQEMAL